MKHAKPLLIAAIVIAALAGGMALDARREAADLRGQVSELTGAAVLADIEAINQRAALVVDHEAALELAHKEGRRAAELWAYRARVASCSEEHGSKKALQLCILALVEVPGPASWDRVRADGFAGFVYVERTFKTRESALADLEGNQWLAKNAEPYGTGLIWEDYPRVLTLAETPTGWAWTLRMTSIEPEPKEG